MLFRVKIRLPDRLNETYVCCNRRFAHYVRYYHVCTLCLCNFSLLFSSNRTFRVTSWVIRFFYDDSKFSVDNVDRMIGNKFIVLPKCIIFCYVINC